MGAGCDEVFISAIHPKGESSPPLAHPPTPRELRAQLRYHYSITGCISADPPLSGGRDSCHLLRQGVALDLSSPIAFHTYPSPMCPIVHFIERRQRGYVTYFPLSATKKNSIPPDKVIQSSKE
ncbi:hypothetical protein JTE90_014902 [Oedothorax gibbosus]|uniref:Uncharacterized protein n=1 Tax=Oedothorax gibbosus TaxID=931172 RepID=A0AAV6VNV6_9ARAC|nr:hypothetical protein JTE90_014902 [Oedothorax gibbosus]